MRRSVLFRRRALIASFGVIISLAALMVAWITPASAAPSTADQVLSLTEDNPATQAIGRDCGYSTWVPAANPQLSLWLFCDTPVYKHGVLQSFSAGGSAARQTSASGTLPQSLLELPYPDGTQPTAGGGPYRFLTVPTNMWLPSHTSTACGGSGTNSYAAAWPSGVAIEPSNNSVALIVYDEVCVENGTISVQGLGMEEYNWYTNKVVGGPYEIYHPTPGAPMPDQWQLGSPVFSGNYLYFFSGSSVTSNKGVFVANVLFTPSHWQNGLTYYFWNGSTWTTDPMQSASILPSGSIPVNASEVSVEPAYPNHGGVVMILTTTIGTKYEIWNNPNVVSSGWSGTPNAGWSKIGSGDTVSTSSQCSNSPNGLCRAIIGHPEFSTNNRMYVSYFDPNVNAPYDNGYNKADGTPEGHLRVAQQPY